MSYKQASERRRRRPLIRSNLAARSSRVAGRVARKRSKGEIEVYRPDESESGRCCFDDFSRHGNVPRLRGRALLRLSRASGPISRATRYIKSCLLRNSTDENRTAVNPPVIYHPTDRELVQNLGVQTRRNRPFTFL